MDPTTNPTPPQTPVAQKQPKSRMKLIVVIIVVLAVAVVVGIVVAQHHSKETAKKHVTEQGEHEDENKAEYIEEGKYAVEVSITANGFSPQTVKVKPETRVVWNNTDSQPHRIGMSNGSEKPEFFDPQDNIKPGDSNTVRFDKVGTYHLFDTLNPTLTFDVIVAN